MIFSMTLSCLNASERGFRERLFEKDDGRINAADIIAELNLGKNLAAKILGTYPLVENPRLQRYVQTLGAGLIYHVGRPELKYHFALIQSDEVNAYAAPGGYIFITEGLFRLMRSEAQLVGVLAHEIAHVNERHVMRKLNIRGRDGGLFSAAGSMIGASTNAYRNAMEMLVNKAYDVLFSEGVTHSDEEEADLFSIELLLNLGYDPRDYLKLFQSIAVELKKAPDQTLRRTHPPLSGRFNLLREFIKENRELISETQSFEERFNQYAKF